MFTDYGGLTKLPGPILSRSSGSTIFTCFGRFRLSHWLNRFQFLRQNSDPFVVFSDPTNAQNGIQTVAIVIPKSRKLFSEGMLVIPNTDVTKVTGKKKIVT
jgi:hypothetical protein